MVREAQKAGVKFDQERMLKLRCCTEDYEMSARPPVQIGDGVKVPQVQISGSQGCGPEDIAPEESYTAERDEEVNYDPGEVGKEFREALHVAAAHGVLHDCLNFGEGLKVGTVLSWKVMEYLPFRRMDLQPDNTWKSIRWPLPKGEVRDIPENALIHSSALRRMEANAKYRPGNLIIGGGGRGVRMAHQKYGMGQWEVVKEEGDPLGEAVVRKKRAETIDMMEK